MKRTTPAALALVASLSLGAGASRGAALHLVGARSEGAADAARSRADAERSPSGPSLCPPGTLPDGDACVRLPDDDDEGAQEAESTVNAHHDKRGRWVVYDQIPRRPDRPADYDAYRYPVPCDRNCVVSGYDLDRPDELQRRGRTLSYVGHGAVDLVQPRGTPVRLVALEHQDGDADVIYVGPLFGTTVITRHALREAGRLRDYILLYGHLDAAAPGIQPGSHLKEGDLVGFVGDTGSPELVHLHLEARRVRDGVDVSALRGGGLSPSMMIANENTVVCDPRNVLPLR